MCESVLPWFFFCLDEHVITLLQTIRELLSYLTGGAL